MAGTNSIGTAWIQIKPSMKGVSQEIKAEISRAGTSSGQSFGNNFLNDSKKYFKDAFSELGNRASAAFSNFKAISLVGITAATAGIYSLAKELDSASGSQRSFAANMKLAGKSTDEIKATFADLTDYANKSIYSLSDMSVTAGILASTGVKNSAELVKAFGNMAAAAENPQQAIRSISQQMAQVNGKGFVQTMDFRIMQEQASGPMKLVQERLMELNHWKPADFQKALSKGKISAEMLNKAMLEVGNNPMLTELAIKPGTIGQAWEGFTSTIASNLSQSEAWQGVQREIIDAISSATDWVDKNKDAIADWVKKVVDAVKKAGDWVVKNKELVKTALMVVAGFKGLQIATGAFISIKNTLTPYVKIINGIGSGIMGLGKKFFNLSGKAKGITDATDQVDKLGKTVNNTPKKFSLGESISGFFKTIGEILNNAVSAIIEPLKKLATGIVDVIKTLAIGIGEAIAGFVKAFADPAVLSGAVGLAAAAASIATAIFLVGTAIGAVTPSLADFLNAVIIPLGMFLLTVVLVAINGITDAIIRLYNEAILPLGEFLLGSFLITVTTLKDTIISVTQEAIIPLVNALTGGLTSALNSIGGLFQVIGGVICGVIDSISGGIAKVIDSIANLIGNLKGADWYGTGFGIVRNFSAGLIDGLTTFIQDALNMLINNILNVPIIGKALKAVGLKPNPVNLRSFSLGRRAYGGYIDGEGGQRDDMNPYLLSNGEYVIQAPSVKSLGRQTMDYINRFGQLPASSNSDVTVNLGAGSIIVNGAEDPEATARAVWRGVSRHISNARREVMA